MINCPKPLSWGDRMELARELRKEAAEKVAEAQRIEDDLSAEQDAVYAAMEAASSKVGDGETANKGRKNGNAQTNIRKDGR